MSQKITIPLHVARAGLTEEYVSAWKRIYEVRDMKTDKRKELTELQDKMYNLLYYRHGSRSMKHPADMEWRDAIALHDLTKELLELRGQYEEIYRELVEATGEHGILALINQQSAKFKEEE